MRRLGGSAVARSSAPSAKRHRRCGAANDGVCRILLCRNPVPWWRGEPEQIEMRNWFAALDDVRD
jgi:hypothetical protein